MPLRTKKPLSNEQKAFIEGAKYKATEAITATEATEATEAITATQAKEDVTAIQAIQATRLSNGYINTKGERKSNLRLLLTDSQIKELKRRAVDRGLSVSEMVALDLDL